MIRRRWKWLLAIALIPIGIRCYDRFQRICWVGDTDLTIEFVVSDLDSANPIPKAKIHIHSEGGFYKKRDEKDFVLITDEEGKVEKVCRDSMCFGTQSGLKFTDTYVVHLPWWQYRVSAEGYTTTNLIELDVMELVRQVQRIGPGQSKLVVRIPLQKTSPTAK
jgi:hypothetical protein